MLQKNFIYKNRQRADLDPFAKFAKPYVRQQRTSLEEKSVSTKAGVPTEDSYLVLYIFIRYRVLFIS